MSSDWKVLTVELRTDCGVYLLEEHRGWWEAVFLRPQEPTVAVRTLSEDGRESFWPTLSVAKLACQQHAARMRDGESAAVAAAWVMRNSDMFAKEGA